MMFLSEMVRHVGDEENLFDEAGVYSTSSDGVWETMRNYGSVNPATAGFYIIKFDIQYITNPAWFRLKIGARWVFGKALTASWVTHYVLVWLPTGSQTILAEGYGWTGVPDGVAQIRNFEMGRVEFSDVDAEALQTYSSGLTLNVPQRNLPIGSLKQVCVAVYCFAYTSDAQTNFENVGDSLTNGVSLTFEGTQVNWTERFQDTDSKENASAYYIGVADATQDITVSITKDNGSTVVHISVIVCPWILPSDTDFEPIELSFPQASTLYLMLEPLITNPTKNVKIGKRRAISFGDTTDYYSTASGANILTHDYQFVEVKNGAVLLYMYGWGGCVASIGVDIR